MVIINYDGTTYYGRLISIQAIEQELVGTDNKKVIKNVGYDVPQCATIQPCKHFWTFGQTFMYSWKTSSGTSCPRVLYSNVLLFKTGNGSIYEIAGSS